MGMVLIGAWVTLIAISIPMLTMGNKVIRWLLLGSYIAPLPYCLYKYETIDGHLDGILGFMLLYGPAVLAIILTIVVVGGGGLWLYYFLRWFFYGNKKSR